MNTTQNSASNKQSLETRIGLYWLHKLGIVSVVLGIVFLIMYSFQYVGPVLQLLTGLAVSTSLILLGSKMAAKDKQKWFGHGLTAGGWSLLFFTTYAAYYLKHVVTSLPLEAILLLAVAAGSLFSALSAKSEIMSIYSVTLASGSILLTGPGLIGDVSYLIIAIAASVLANKRSWYNLFAFGMAACYLGHIYCSLSAASTYDHTLNAVFLGGIWLTFTLGLGYFIPDSDRAKKFTTIMSCLNAAAIAAGLVCVNSQFVPEVAQGLLAAAGSVYLATSRWLSNRKATQMETVHSVLGLSLLNTAKVMRFSGVSLIAVDIMEIAILGTLSAKYNLKVFSWFAAGLCCTLFPLWIYGASVEHFNSSFGFFAFRYVEIGFWALLVLCSLARLHFGRLQAAKAANGPLPLATDFYYCAANLMAILLISQVMTPDWQICAYILAAVANGFVSLKIKRDLYACLETLFLVMTILMFEVDWGKWLTLPASVAIAMLYGMHAYGRTFPRADKSMLSKGLTSAYAFVANIALTLLILWRVPSDYTSAGLGLEGIALLICGFLLRDRFFRISGLCVLALLTSKLLFLDLANYNTLERILSFVAAGVVFLLSSYGYAWYTRAFEDEIEIEKEEEEEAEEEHFGNATDGPELCTGEVS